MNIIEGIDEYLSEHLNMNVDEFRAMFDHSSLDVISGPSDIKVALSNALKANRVLAKMKAKMDAINANRDKLLIEKWDAIREEFYRYNREIKSDYTL